MGNCKNCGEGGFDDGWEWLCGCKGKVRVAIDSFSTPRWNQGLGCFTSSVHETEKIARKKGLEPVGDARMEQIFHEKDYKSEIRRDIVESRKMLWAQAIKAGRL